MTDSLVARARVLAVRADGRVSLKLSDGPACPGCRCGRLTLAEPPAVALELTQGAQIPAGTEVLVSTPVREILRGAAHLHGLPWALMVLGASVGAAAGFGDLGCLAGGVVGLAMAVLLLRYTQERWRGLSSTAIRVAPSR